MAAAAPIPAAPKPIIDRITPEEGGTATISCSLGSDRAIGPQISRTTRRGKHGVVGLDQSLGKAAGDQWVAAEEDAAAGDTTAGRGAPECEAGTIGNLFVDAWASR